MTDSASYGRRRRTVRQLGLGVAAFIAVTLLPGCTPSRDSTESPSQSVPASAAADRTTEPPLPPTVPIAPGESHSYRLALEAGDFLTFTVEQQGVDVILRLFEPSGERLIETDLPIADLGRELLLAVADRPGDYRLEVEAWDTETASGDYSAEIQVRRASDLDRISARAAETFYRAEQRAWAGEFERAAGLYQSSLEAWTASRDLYWQGLNHAQLGASFMALGRRQRAIEAREKATAVFAEIGEKRLEAISEFNLGLLHFDLGDLDRAAEHLQRSLELRRRVGDSRGEAFALTRLADIYKVRGETQAALDRFTEALAHLEAPKDRRYRATALHSLGTLYRRLGKTEAALANFEAAQVIYEQLELSKARAASLNQIGRLHLDLGDHEQALATLAVALDLQRQFGDRRGQASTLRKIGAVHLAASDLDAAKKHYLSAFDLLQKTDSPRHLAPVLADLGSLHQELADHGSALDYYRRALAKFESIGDPIGTTRAILGTAQALRERKNLGAARDAGERALRIAETLRIKPLRADLRLAFFSTVHELFDFYIDLLMQMHELEPSAGHAAEALRVSERARARSLLDLLAEAGAEIRDGTAPELLAREKRLQRLLNDSVDRMESEADSESSRAAGAESVRKALEELDRTRAAIRRSSPRYAALTQPQPLSLNEIQGSVLDSETILLQYWLGEDRSYLWMVKQDSVEAFELPAEEIIEAHARRAHRSLRQSHRRETEPQARRSLCDLSRLLLAPVKGMLGSKRLAIAADGALHYLPIAALPDPDSGLECLDAEPLVAKHEIVHLPSASTLAVLRSDSERSRSGGGLGRETPPGLLAVIADPVFTLDDPRVAIATDSGPSHQASLSIGDLTRSGGSPRAAGREVSPFARLPHTRSEARAILEMVPPESATVAMGFAASKQAVLSGILANHRLVHFATHGVLDAEVPALSGVALSGIDESGRPVDGLLRAHEVYNLDLAADLVVLGGCETALGKEVKGEGLIGLARGFMYAGAPRVMVSLWKVGDRSTAALMTAFYRAMLAEGLSPAAALRSAQLEIRRTHPQPYYWAGFILQGEWRAGTLE